MSIMKRPYRTYGVVTLATVCLSCHAHGNGEHSPGWTFDPWIVAPLAIALVCYAGGLWRLSRRSRALPLRRRHAVWFAVGWTTLALALLSPLHTAGERAFSAHMLEHELLMLLSAPCLVLARPLGVLLWSLPQGVRRWVGRTTQGSVFAWTWQKLTHPAVATALQAIALWLWHAPVLFGLALASEDWHVVQHLSFLVTALLFWTAMLDPVRMRTQPAAVIVCLFVTALVSGALGALMAFSASPWYAGYAALGMTSFGLTPVQDQQVAGLLMWIPGGVIHAGAALAVLARMLRTGAGGTEPQTSPLVSDGAAQR